MLYPLRFSIRYFFEVLAALFNLTIQGVWGLIEWGLAGVFGLLACLGAMMIVVSRNIVRMAVYLLMTLAGVAGLYFLMDAEFLGAIQLIVYAGGTLVLIVFGVMLTSRSLWGKLAVSWQDQVAAVALGVLALTSLLLVTYRTVWPVQPLPANLGAGKAINALSINLLSVYLVPLELVAVLLLVVMIGAAYLAKSRRGEQE